MAVFRLDPAMGVGSYKTYQIRQPVSERTRISSCQAAGCPNYQNGWETRIDESTDLGGRQAHFIRTRSERRYTVTKLDGITIFTFEPGQQCFQQHHVPDRPQLFSVRDGDWRGNPTGRKLQHTRAADWVDDFGEHQARLADQIEKG